MMPRIPPPRIEITVFMLPFEQPRYVESSAQMPREQNRIDLRILDRRSELVCGLAFLFRKADLCAARSVQRILENTAFGVLCSGDPTKRSLYG